VTGPRLTEAQRLDWLRLIRSENVGPLTFRALVNQFGGARAALDALPDLARRGGRPALKVPSRAKAEREMDGLSRLGARLLALGEPDYPKALQAIEGAPPLVAVRGDPAVLGRPAVAIVGSRNASAAGLTFTERLGRGLGGAGLVVVSGLARGIDTPPTRPPFKRARSPCSPAGSTGSTRRTMRACWLASWTRVARPCPRCRSAGRPAAAIFPDAIAWSLACRTASWWSRRRGARPH
jgi:hypothetical protein